MGNFKLDDRIKVIGKNVKGKIAFIGKTHFTDGVMFGVVLDKPKGRNNGTVGDVNYFTCSENHGVFVRSCQLETDDGESSDCSDSSARDVARPAYPNYLKHSSKIHRKFKHHSRHKEQASKAKTVLKQNIQPRKKQPQTLGEIKINTVKKGNCISEPKLAGIQQSPRRQRRIEIDEELGFLVKKLNERNQQINVVHQNLKKIKTYLRWSRRFDAKRDPMRILLDNVIDTVINSVEETIDEGEVGMCHNYPKEYKELEKENSSLIQQVWDLEKRNRTLTQCMTQIRDILLGSWIRSQALIKSKSKRDRKKNVEKENNKNKRGSSSPKKEGNNLRDSHKKNKQALNANLLSEAQEHIEFECVKKHPEVLKNDLEKPGFQFSDAKKGYSKEVNIKHESEFVRKTNLTLENSKTNHKQSTKEEINEKFRENDSSTFQKALRSPKKMFRIEPYNKTSSKNTHVLEELNNPAKEVFDLISNIMSKIEEAEQKETSTKNSSLSEIQESNLIESAAIFKKCTVLSDSDKIKKETNIWYGSRSENNFKLSRSGFRRKKRSPRKHMYSTPANERKRLVSDPSEI
ncbi:CAP-Gly domain-containing protein [Trichonephila clavata]|uniref:CAP-Gly domain-containing protein n=1 Tax=Trichonephila clavata TaxID=2740835 RepID=A0A8X6GKZ6_TRICU|nr:CAP-Gly domain-containing protein [Trichonephila clavata]